MKIMIIGYSGSGKSTLAKKLGAKYDIPVLHLDTVQWLPGWKERDPESKSSIIEKFLNENESWVIDGNYEKFHYERRLEEADLIIELVFGRLNCYLRAWRRLLMYKGKSRPDMTEGCEEKIDWDFTKWIFIDGRTREKREKYQMVQKLYPEKTMVIKNQKELDAFIK